jgi:hypothetical protein
VRTRRNPPVCSSRDPTPETRDDGIMAKSRSGGPWRSMESVEAEGWQHDRWMAG